MSNLHSYESTTDYSTFLHAKSFFDIYIKRKNSNKMYLSLYEGFELKKNLTFKEFFEETESYIYFLKNALKIKEKDKVIIQTGNSYHTIQLYTASLLLNLTIIPVSTEESSQYIKNIYNSSCAKILISHNSNQFDFPLNNIDISEFDLTKKTPIQRSSQSLSSLAAIFFTSGTTGNPKGVKLSLGNLLINSEATKREHDLTNNSIHFSSLPLCHVNAFSFSFMTNLYAESTFIYQTSFFQMNYWKIIKEHNVNIVSATPHIINLLNLDPRDFEPKSFPSLKYFVSASAPLSKDDIINFVNKYRVRINQAYGLSETVNFSLTIPNSLSDDEYNEVMLNQEIPSAGSPIFGNEVHIADPETNQLLPEGKVGEIVINGWNVLEGYFENPSATDLVFKGGFFHTGDTGYFLNLNNKKYIFINGRIKEIAKRNGLLAYLSEVELFLKKILVESNFCVTVFPNKYTGDEIGLIIENFQEVNLDELKTFISQNFPPHKRPKVIMESFFEKTSTLKPKRLAMSYKFSSYQELRINDDEILIHEK